MGHAWGHVMKQLMPFEPHCDSLSSYRGLFLRHYRSVRNTRTCTHQVYGMGGDDDGTFTTFATPCRSESAASEYLIDCHLLGHCGAYCKRMLEEARTSLARTVLGQFEGGQMGVKPDRGQ